MSKFIKINKFIFLLLFLCSCGFGDALQGKKRSDQGDEFLIDKKNPLAMPPDFDKLPKPGQTITNSIEDKQTDNQNLKDLLKNNQIKNDNLSNETSTSIESSILKKIK